MPQGRKTPKANPCVLDGAADRARRKGPMALQLEAFVLDPGVMAQQQDNWEMELEESAQGTDSYSAPGGEAQLEEAREAAKEWSAGEPGRAGPPGNERVETARVRRHRLGDALVGLEGALARPSAAGDWLDGVREGMAELRLSLEEHIEVTEGSGGLLKEVVDVAPRLSNEVALIETEHQELLEALAKAETGIDESHEPGAVRQRAMAILSQLSLHRQRGADLVYEAYNVDIAAGD